MIWEGECLERQREREASERGREGGKCRVSEIARQSRSARPPPAIKYVRLDLEQNAVHANIEIDMAFTNDSLILYILSVLNVLID